MVQSGQSLGAGAVAATTEWGEGPPDVVLSGDSPLVLARCLVEDLITDGPWFPGPPPPTSSCCGSSKGPEGL